MSAIFDFVSLMAVTGMAIVGFVSTISHCLTWLQSHRPNSSAQVNRFAFAAEDEIDRLQAAAISDMFDLARRSHLEQRIQEGQR